MPFTPVVCGTLALLCTIAFSNAAEEKFHRQLLDATHNYLIQKAEKVAHRLDSDRFQVRIQPLKKQIRLPACQLPLDIKDITQSDYGAQHLEVSCTGHWKQPVKGRIQVFLPMIASTRSIGVNRVIKETDIQWLSKDISTLAGGYYTQPEQVLGKRAKTVIKAGSTIDQKMIFH